MTSILETALDASTFMKWISREFRNAFDPVEEVIFRLNGYIKQLFEISHLKKVNINCARWTRGRPYNTEGTILLTPSNLTNLSYLNLEVFNIQGGTVLLTLTNLTSLSYLDLPEYSIDCKEFLEQQQLSRILIEKRLHELQDVECLHLRAMLTDIFNEITEQYKEHVMEHILMEVNLITAISLLQKWDGEKFRRFETRLRTSKISNEYFMDIYFYVCSRILIEHCNFEKVSNVEFIMTFAESFWEYEIMKKLPVSHVHFYMLHIAYGLLSHPQPDKFKTMVGDLMWIETAFIDGDTCNLQYLLALGWPTSVFKTVEDFFCEKCGRSAGNPKLSLMSIPFSITLMVRIFDYTLTSEAPKEAKTSCIRLLWRAIPTPYASEDDMNKHINMHLNRHSSCSAYKNSSQELWQTEKGSFFDVYPEDCLADYQPRSLMHLSRCKIRESLDFKQRTVFLPLSNRLIRYLNLEW